MRDPTTTSRRLLAAFFAGLGGLTLTGLCALGVRAAWAGLIALAGIVLTALFAVLCARVADRLASRPPRDGAGGLVRAEGRVRLPHCTRSAAAGERAGGPGVFRLGEYR